MTQKKDRTYSIPFDEAGAILTHYLQNKGTTFAFPFREPALTAWHSSNLTTGKTSDMPTDADLPNDLFSELRNVPFIAPMKTKFTFIDLFAGIGGFRLALQQLGGKCVFSSEWDTQAQKTYLTNFGEMPFGDITQESVKRFIPDRFDLLCAGFPCQAFSLAGKRLGFEETRGTSWKKTERKS